MIELKPCPFCGREAVMDVVEPHTHVIATFMPDYEGGAFIECLGCSAAISGRTAEEATTAWNHRAHPVTGNPVSEQPDNVPLTLDELRGMDGEPVWIVEQAKQWSLSAWVLCMRTEGSFLRFMQSNGYTIYRDVRDYGEKLLAYRHKPKEEV